MFRLRFWVKCKAKKIRLILSVLPNWWQSFPKFVGCINLCFQRTYLGLVYQWKAIPTVQMQMVSEITTLNLVATYHGCMWLEQWFPNFFRARSIKKFKHSTKYKVVLQFADHLSWSRGPLVVHGADFGKQWVRGLLQNPVTNYLPHTISILNSKIIYENAAHCFSFLPWLSKKNLGLAKWALKRHVFLHA